MADGSNADLSTELTKLRQTAEVREEKILDLEDEMEQLQRQHDVLENFVFALEGEHEQARKIIEQTQGKLLATNERLLQVLAEQDDILATVSQGILTINDDGSFNAQYSSQAETIFGRADFGAISIYDLFDDDEKVKRGLHQLIDVLFNHGTAGPKLIMRLNPLRRYTYRNPKLAEERILSFGFSRIRDSRDASVSKLLVTVDDLTREHELSEALSAKSREYEAKLEQIFHISMLPRESFTGFIEETEAALHSVQTCLYQLAGASQSKEGGERTKAINEGIKLVHGIKGNARALNLDAMTTAAHELEDAFELLKTTPDADALVLETCHARLETLRGTVDEGANYADKLFGLKEVFTRDPVLLSRELETFLKSLLESESRRDKQQVALQYRSELIDDRISRRTFHKLRAVLLQLMRNTLAHGIEDQTVRTALGKPACGMISVDISRDGDEADLCVQYEDDGRGIDPTRVRQIAETRGLITAEQARAMDEDEARRLIFLPGFSTNQQADILSGRGVGMNLVADDLESIGAVVEVESEKNKFTRFIIKMPLDEGDASHTGST